ncbi:AMP-binding protein, partial [Kitasatospora sp. NPDC057541]
MNRAVPTGLPQLLAHRAAAHPERTAVVNGADRLDFGAWQARSGALAAALCAAGLRPGDRVGLRHGTA